MQAPLQGENSAILVGKELSDQPISPLRIYFAEFTAQNRGIEKQRETGTGFPLLHLSLGDFAPGRTSWSRWP